MFRNVNVDEGALTLKRSFQQMAASSETAG
jgi:hypothetical protein